MKEFGKFSYSILLLIIGIFINSFVLMKLYNWIILPIFEVKELTYISFIGILVIITFIKARYEEIDNDIDYISSISKRFIFSSIDAGYTLLFGWIVSIFI